MILKILNIMKVVNIFKNFYFNDFCYRLLVDDDEDL